MLIDMSSWKSSLQAYGIRTSEICKIRETVRDPATDQDRPEHKPTAPTAPVPFYLRTVAQPDSNGYLGFVAAAPTLVGVRSCVGDGHQSTQVANVNLVRIRSFKQTLFEELGSTVSDLTVTFHLSKTQTAVPASDTGWSVCVRAMDGSAGRRN